MERTNSISTNMSFSFSVGGILYKLVIVLSEDSGSSMAYQQLNRSRPKQRSQNIPSDRAKEEPKPIGSIYDQRFAVPS